MRSEKQKIATKRNHEIMRLKGIIANASMLSFTETEKKNIQDACDLALSRLGVFKQLNTTPLFVYEAPPPKESKILNIEC